MNPKQNKHKTSIPKKIRLKTNLKSSWNRDTLYKGSMTGIMANLLSEENTPTKDRETTSLKFRTKNSIPSEAFKMKVRGID